MDPHPRIYPDFFTVATCKVSNRYSHLNYWPNIVYHSYYVCDNDLKDWRSVAVWEALHPYRYEEVRLGSVTVCKKRQDPSKINYSIAIVKYPVSLIEPLTHLSLSLEPR